jgi:hypothetical protein
MSYLNADRAEPELAQSIQKACNNEETAPKQKHVRSKFMHFRNPELKPPLLECTVYTWDHRSAAVIWNIVKVQPLLSDEVQAFKALILIHRVVKDGHPNVMKRK